MPTGETTSYGVYTSGLYRHARAYQYASGEIFFTCPERIGYQDREDTIAHECADREFLADIAVRYYKDYYPNPVLLAEAIAQFQPEPIIDHLEPLEAGTQVLIPSVEYLEEYAFGESLSEFEEL